MTEPGSIKQISSFIIFEVGQKAKQTSLNSTCRKASLPAGRLEESRRGFLRGRGNRCTAVAVTNTSYPSLNESELQLFLKLY